jgi:hypothetical protein
MIANGENAHRSFCDHMINKLLVLNMLEYLLLFFIKNINLVFESIILFTVPLVLFSHRVDILLNILHLNFHIINLKLQLCSWRLDLNHISLYFLFLAFNLLFISSQLILLSRILPVHLLFSIHLLFDLYSNILSVKILNESFQFLYSPNSFFALAPLQGTLTILKFLYDHNLLHLS